jgi:hypothetical protein
METIQTESTELVNPQRNFDQCFAKFLEGARAKVAAYDSGFPTLEASTLEVIPGSRYLKIAIQRGTGRSVWAFIDKTNGDVLKPAGWKAPAKHARGNIFDLSFGLKNCNHHGPAYLR